MKRHSSILVAMTQLKSVPLISFDSKLTTKDISNIKKANIDKALACIKYSFKRGVKVICLNELYSMPYFPISCKLNPLWFAWGEDIETGESITPLIHVTRKYKTVVVAPIYECDKNQKKYYNTTVIIDNGKILGICRKTHVPFGKNEQGVFAERFYYQPSDTPALNKNRNHIKSKFSPYLPVFETGYCKIGVNICYGRHFPENWRVLRNNGADLVFCPSVTFGSVSKRLWKHEFITAAVWNSYFVGASNRLGRESCGLNTPYYFGSSFFVSPDGLVLKNEAGDGYRNKMVISEIDLNQVGSNPAGWRLAADERKDILISSSVGRGGRN